MELVNPTPPLPNAPQRFNEWEQPSFDGDMVRTLTAYLRDVAYRLNKAVTIDGGEVMEGDLDLGGFNIVNVGNVVSSIKTTVFTASGTWTRDANCLAVEVTGWGGGGAGGGAPATPAANHSIGAGGHGGAKAVVRLTAAAAGSSQTVTIGAGGTGVSGTTGNAGGNTTFGALLSARGGSGGGISGPIGSTGSFHGNVSAALQSATGDIRGHTMVGETGSALSNTVAVGTGGQTEWGGGGRAGNVATGTNIDGVAGIGFGAGGSGSYRGASQAATVGGAGRIGLMIVREYLHA